LDYLIAQITIYIIKKTGYCAKSLLQILLDGKILIDRWGNLTTNIVINPKHKNYIDNISNHKNFHINKSIYNIWAVDIEYSDDVPEEYILFFANEESTNDLYHEDDIDKSQFIVLNSGKKISERAIAVIPMIQYSTEKAS
jgi:hypothetical protein